MRNNDIDHIIYKLIEKSFEEKEITIHLTGKINDSKYGNVSINDRDLSILEKADNSIKQIKDIIEQIKNEEFEKATKYLQSELRGLLGIED